MAPSAFTVESSYDGNIWVPQGSFSGLSWSLGQQQTFSFSVQYNDTFIGADRIDYVDTFLVCNKPKTPQFLVSGGLSVTFDPLDFANKSGGSDLLVTLCVAKREIWLLGQFTSEVWYDTGGDGTPAGSFPFLPMSGVFIPHGCLAKYSVATIDNHVYWLSRTREGQCIVISGGGYQATRISTYAIEAELQGYTRVDDAVGYTYQLDGHMYYVLAFPNADRTWAFDVSTQLWHELVWLDSNGTEHRHRGNCACAAYGQVVLGDWFNGNLYALDPKVGTDIGQPIKRLRSFPHMLTDTDRIFYRQLRADLETGTAPELLAGGQTLLEATFAAPDDTNLSAYVSDVGGGWTAVGGAANAQIVGGKLMGTGGAALYQSAIAPTQANYTLRFSVVPPAYGSVPSGVSIFAIGRAAGANTGYRVMVSGDGTRYTLSLATLPSGASATVSMGTIASGVFIVWLLLRGTSITAQVQRTQDGLWLRTDGTWHTAPGTIAAQFNDATYAAAGAVMIGGTWPTPSLIEIPQVPLPADPNFPSGYSDAIDGAQTFDFTRNLQYTIVSGSGVGGIAVTDLNTMHVLRTTTADQMYAGTPYGIPPGSPPSQNIYDLTCGNGTDLYMLTGGDPTYSPEGEFCRFTRVDATTLRVTGEFYIAKAFPPPIVCVMGALGVVNTTAAHTIVVYPTNGALGLGPQIMDGTGMAPIGLGPVPSPNGYSIQVIAGAKHSDGSCDFLMFNPDWNGTSGNINVWRINVSDSLAVTSTKSTLNVFPIVPGITQAQIAQVEYDAAHDTIILWLSGTDNAQLGPPVTLVSINYDASVNWTLNLPSDIGIYYSKGQSRLTGGTLMVGGGSDLKLIDTATGAVTYTGSVPNVSGSFYRVYDASRGAYWTYGLSTTGFTRIAFPPALAMDDLVGTMGVQLNQNLISLRWSDDRGHSYGSPVTQSIGEAGSYLTSLQWQRLGMARDRVFELSWSVPMRTTLQGAWVDATPAGS
jgi:hypothetical protein